MFLGLLWPLQSPIYPFTTVLCFLYPFHFEFGSGESLGWKEWVDSELSDTGFMGLLQRAGILKVIVSSRCLSNFRDLYNLRHLVRRWCTTTHTFFFSCSELTVTFEDVAN